MYPDVYDKCFNIQNPGACLTHLLVFVQRGFITHCEIHGACEGNLKVLALSLTGEKLSDAILCLDYCCDQKQPCMQELHKTLVYWFTQFIKEYDK